MSEIAGIEFVIGFEDYSEDIDDRLDLVLAEITRPEFVSIDYALNLARGSVSFLMGVRAPEGVEPIAFASDLAVQELTRALRTVGLAPSGTSEGLRPSARVLEFA